MKTFSWPLKALAPVLDVMDFWRAWFRSLGPEFVPRGWMDGWSTSQRTSIRKGQAWWSERGGSSFIICLLNIRFIVIGTSNDSDVLRYVWSFNLHPQVPAVGCSPWLPAWPKGLRGLRLSPWPPSGSAPWSPAWSAGSSSCRNSLQGPTLQHECYVYLYFFS